MAKVLLVEDDNNLREIYQARLMAEGYTIVSAQDGEEALVMAKKEHPDLIISDVMMPRISGFEMLDILRNTDELKHTKVIMLTALGQAEDQTRADNLGADKYLVKSQVTLEDIVKSAEELLTADGAPGMPTPASVAPEAAPAPAAQESTTGATEATTPVDTAPALPPAAAPDTPSAVQEPAVAPMPVASEPPAVPPSSAETPSSAPVAPEPPVTAAPSASTPVVTAVATAAEPPVAVAPTPVEPSAAAAAVSVPAPAAAPVPATPAIEPATDDVPAPATKEAAEPVALAEPSQEAAESAPALAPEPTPVAKPEPTEPAVDSLSPQSLQAEEEALQKQIDSFAEEPGTDPPAAEPTAAATNDDAVLAQAVEQLNTPEEPAPVEETPPPITEPVLPPAEPAASSPEKLGDSSPVAGKKIIQPLTDPVPKPSLDELLAKEAAKAEPAPPTPIIDGRPTDQKPGQDFDPNSISL